MLSSQEVSSQEFGVFDYDSDMESISCRSPKASFPSGRVISRHNSDSDLQSTQQSLSIESDTKYEKLTLNLFDLTTQTSQHQTANQIQFDTIKEMIIKINQKLENESVMQKLDILEQLISKNSEQIHDLQSKVDTILESTRGTRNIIGAYDVLQDGQLERTSNDLDANETLNNSFPTLASTASVSPASTECPTLLPVHHEVVERTQLTTQEVEIVRTTSKNRRQMSTKLLTSLCKIEYLKGRTIYPSKVRGVSKLGIDSEIVHFIKETTFNSFPILSDEVEKVEWQKCLDAMHKKIFNLN